MKWNSIKTDEVTLRNCGVIDPRTLTNILLWMGISPDQGAYRNDAGAGYRRGENPAFVEEAVPVSQPVPNGNLYIMPRAIKNMFVVTPTKVTLEHLWIGAY